MPRSRPPGRRPGVVSLALVALAAAVSAPAFAADGPTATPGSPAHADSVPDSLVPNSSVPNGSTATGRSPLGAAAAPKALPPQRQGVVPGQVLLTLDAKTSVTGSPVAGSRLAARTPRTNSAPLDSALHAAGASSLHPLFPSLSKAATDSLTTTARSRLGSGVSDLSRTYVVRTHERDSAAVAERLRNTAGVAHAEPNRYVNTMNTGAQPLPKQATPLTKALTKATATTSTNTPAIPTNYALSTSAQAFLNAGGVNASGAFATLQGTYGQQPGTGRTITNVSIGDLTDRSMADAGDAYVRGNGPTTILKDGQRYLDLPSMPLIPTYVAGTDGRVDGAASTENQDPSLGEVLLDFSVMAPLAHDRQRPDATGSGYTDLLGIAPGAAYRLVVPQQPTIDQIAGALLAAAHQSPRPDVITASLGFGTDQQGFPGRYLEDDPYVRSVVASIVQKDGIVVSISSNDGTRLYTPASVGPDGGSTPTDLAPRASAATTIDDVEQSTTPSRLPDTGAIAAGGTTLDDTLAAPADPTRTDAATTAETRVSGFGTFSSGFGTRIDLSAPSDNIIAFTHTPGQDARAVTPVLNGGTSASAPEIAAAAAVVLHAGELVGRHLEPAEVRDLLERTGRAVSTPAQIDRKLNVGPQIDVTAATRAALALKGGRSTKKATTGTKHTPALVRLSVAHRVTTGGLGGSFLETTDQNRIDLGDAASGGNGQALVGPVTFAGDVTGVTDPHDTRYRLTVQASPPTPAAGHSTSTSYTSTTPAIRLTPRQLLTAAGLPLTSTEDRNVTVTYAVLVDGKVRASETRTLAVGPSDGRYTEATAPHAPATVKAGHAVTVTYDLSGVIGTSDPQLVVSGVGHWNPALAGAFSAGWHQSLTGTTGTVTVPAEAFTGGGGLYGIGIVQKGFGGNPQQTTYGEFAPVRVDGATASVRPEAPLLTDANGVTGHTAEVTRATPGFGVRYDVRGIPGARYAQVEFSAPAPTLHNSLNTFTNANGTTLDHDGVNTPSSAQRVLPSTSGTVRLDARGLGLTTSDFYGVRVLALDSRHRVVGQASPVSGLAVDDGPAPDGSTVLSFAVGGAAGDTSVAALRTAAGTTEITHYSATTGRYGPVIASDAGDTSDYEVLGVAPAAHRALVVHQPAQGGDVRVETWNTATDTLVGSTELAADTYTFVVGRVDAARARGALLLRAVADNADVVLPVDLADGSTTGPIPADPAGVGAGTYSVLDIDASTGDVYLAKGAPAFLCLGGVTAARVNLTTRAVTGAGSTSGCSHGIAADGAGKLYNLSATALSTKIAPTAVLGSLDLATGAAGDAVTVRRGAPVALGLDGTNGIAVASFAAPEGTIYFGSQQGVVLDNNATGQLVITDLRSGAPARTLNGVSVTGHGGSLVHGGLMNSVQLDPATRTGWTYGPYDTQIQQFSY
ncbi:hypothetical protein [Streptomyces liangshanensis]|uniref:hypothetical protein n=1 Tax=Streptomyces liangshanensis TaxID=2717324 RepID=UPI0036D98ABB